MRASDQARLEAIAESNDPSIKPGDRIRAIELLRQDAGVDEKEQAALHLARQVAGMSDEQLTKELERFAQPRYNEDAVEREVQRRVGSVLAKNEQELWRRAQQLADKIAADRLLGTVEREATEAGPSSEERSTSAPPRSTELAPPDLKQPQGHDEDAPAWRRQIPPGVDPRANGLNWPSGRP